MPGENGEPDVDRVELPHLLDYETDPERHEDLRDHRDVQRTLRISGPLHPPRVGQRHGDEQPGNAEHMEKLDTDVHDDRVVHSEHGEQLPWQEQEEQSHERRHRQSVARRDMNRLRRAIRMAGAEVLPRHRGRRSHQTDRRPRDERKQLRVGDRECTLRGRALCQRANERQHQDAADVHRNALNAGRQSETEQLFDDGPIGAVSSSFRERHDPSSTPQLPERVDGDQS